MCQGPGFVHTPEATQMQKRRAFALHLLKQVFQKPANERTKNRRYFNVLVHIIQEITKWTENLAGVAEGAGSI